MPASMTPSRKRWRSGPRWTCCTTSAPAGRWTGLRRSCGSAADEAHRRRPETAADPRPRRQARAGRARSRCESGRRGVTGRGHGGHLHRLASNSGDDRARGGPGRCGRRRSLDSLRGAHDPVPSRARSADAGGAQRRPAHRRRYHPAGGCRGARAAGHRETVRSRDAHDRSHQVHRGVGGRSAMSRLTTLAEEYRTLALRLEQGGGPEKIRRQHEQGKLTARERLGKLLDNGSPWLELGMLVAYDQYNGQAPAAGVVTGLGRIHGRPVVVVANDATVKAGSWWPETIKKMLRAQEVAMRQRIPIVYLVDSAGVNLPYQGGVFPGQYGAARLFYYISIMRRYLRVPQIAAVMGPCIAGGAYLPALSDVIFMVEGTSFMGLGGPNLVKGATGQTVDAETLGGATTHTAISAVAHYRAATEVECLERIREYVGRLPRGTPAVFNGSAPKKNGKALYDALPADHRMSYDTHLVLEGILDGGVFDPFQPDVAPEILCGHGRVAGRPVAV